MEIANFALLKREHIMIYVVCLNKKNNYIDSI